MSMHTSTGYSTGTYTVIRAGVGEWVKGRWVAATPTTLTMDADIQPIANTSLQDLEEGQTQSETQTVFTDFQLFNSRPSPDGGGDTGVGLDADLVVVDGVNWRVISVQHYGVLSGHYVAIIERLDK